MNPGPPLRVPIVGQEDTMAGGRKITIALAIVIPLLVVGSGLVLAAGDTPAIIGGNVQAPGYEVAPLSAGYGCGDCTGYDCGAYGGNCNGQCERDCDGDCDEDCPNSGLCPGSADCNAAAGLCLNAGECDDSSDCYDSGRCSGSSGCAGSASTRTSGGCTGRCGRTA